MAEGGQFTWLFQDTSNQQKNQSANTKTAFDWKAGLEGDLAKDVMAYVTVSTGHRPAGYNIAAIDPNKIFFDQESLQSFELGIKSRFADNRIQVNGDVYFYDYRNFQVADFAFVPGSGLVLNIQNRGKVYNKGFEIETNTLLTRTTMFSLAYTYLKNTYQDNFTVEGGPYDLPAPLQMKGKSLPHSPANTVKSSLRQSINLPGGNTLTPVIDYRWLDKQYISTYPGIPETENAYSNVDLSLRFAPKNYRWNVNAYVRNLTNKITKAGEFGANVFISTPRTYGVSFTGRF